MGLDIEKIKELHAECLAARRKADDALAFAEMLAVKSREANEAAKLALREWRNAADAVRLALEIGEPPMSMLVDTWT